MRFGRWGKSGKSGKDAKGGKDPTKVDDAERQEREQAGARDAGDSASPGPARLRSAQRPDDEPPTRDIGTRTRDSTSNPLSHRFDVEEERATRILAGAPDAPPDADGRTRILSHGANEPAASRDRMDDPPAGWLVVVEGPGMAQHVAVGYGMNSIGRDAGQRIRLNFGDERISRQGHAMVSYDDKSRKFFVQHGGGPSLTYLRDEPLLTPQELVDGDVIRLGDTALMFRQLCGPDFDWLALSAPDSESET